MGNIFSAKQKHQTQTSTSAPWKEQQPYLTSGFQQGQTALNQALATPSYTGDFTAAFTPDQQNAFNLIRAYSQGTGSNIADTVTQAGLQGIQNNGAYGSNAQGVYDKFLTDGTDSIIANANKYADNPALQGQIDSAIADVKRGLGIDTANLNANASGNGTINSSRTGLTEAALNRDAMTTAGNIATNLRSAAYNNGLNLASSDRINSLTGALNANNEVGNAASQGLDFAKTGYDLSNQNNQNILDIGNQQQTQAQNEITGELNKNNYLTNQDLDLIGKYMSIVSGNYGGTTSTQIPYLAPSTWNTAIGSIGDVVGIARSLYKTGGMS